MYHVRLNVICGSVLIHVEGITSINYNDRHTQDVKKESSVEAYDDNGIKRCIYVGVGEITRKMMRVSSYPSVRSPQEHPPKSRVGCHDVLCQCHC